MKRFASASAAVFAAALAGCDTTPRNEGHPKSYRIESRLPAEGTALGSVDLVVATDKAVAQIADVPEIRQAGGPTVIVMDRIENKTSDPSASNDVFLARIRSSLIQSGAKKNLTFVETRAKAEDIKAREGIPAGQSARQRPRYALTGTFYDMPRGGTNYHLLTFQLVDLTNDLIPYEGTYEVKY
jgi:hypothetical protein